MKHPRGSWMLGEEHWLYNAITYWDTISVLHLVSSKYRISHPWRVIIFHEGRKWVIKVFLRSKTRIRIFINVRNNLFVCCFVLFFFFSFYHPPPPIYFLFSKDLWFFVFKLSISQNGTHISFSWHHYAAWEYCYKTCAHCHFYLDHN